MSKKAQKSEDGKKLYELAFLLKNADSEKAVLDLLSARNISVASQSKVNHIKLAYPVKKHASAYFGYLDFESNPEDVKELSTTLRFNGEVIRFLIVSAQSGAKTAERKEDRRAEKTKPAESGQLSNEALEEKLEEILK